MTRLGSCPTFEISGLSRRQLIQPPGFRLYRLYGLPGFAAGWCLRNNPDDAGL